MRHSLNIIRIFDWKNFNVKSSKAYFSTLESKISFTTDLWTSPNNKAFAAVTAHFIDNDWVLHETVVDFGLMSGRHDGANIADGFSQVLENFGIMAKVLDFFNPSFILDLSFIIL